MKSKVGSIIQQPMKTVLRIVEWLGEMAHLTKQLPDKPNTLSSILAVLKKWKEITPQACSLSSTYNYMPSTHIIHTQEHTNVNEAIMHIYKLLEICLIECII